MVDKAVHQVKVRLPIRVASAIRQAASSNGLHAGTLCRLIVCKWLRRHDERATDACHDESRHLESTRAHTSEDVTLKLLLTESEWERLKVLSDAEGDLVGRFVA